MILITDIFRLNSLTSHCLDSGQRGTTENSEITKPQTLNKEVADIPETLGNIFIS
jgi:hypothetical protein